LGSNPPDTRGRGAARAEDAPGTPTQSHISPSILVYEGERRAWCLGLMYLRLIDSCITQLKAQRPARTCNESTEERERVDDLLGGVLNLLDPPRPAPDPLPVLEPAYDSHVG